MKPTQSDVERISDALAKQLVDNNDVRHEVYGCAKQSNEEKT